MSHRKNLIYITLHNFKKILKYNQKMHFQIKKMYLIHQKENQKLKLMKNNKFKKVSLLEFIYLKKMNNR